MALPLTPGQRTQVEDKFAEVDALVQKARMAVMNTKSGTDFDAAVTAITTKLGEINTLVDA